MELSAPVLGCCAISSRCALLWVTSVVSELPSELWESLTTLIHCSLPLKTSEDLLLPLTAMGKMGYQDVR